MKDLGGSGDCHIPLPPGLPNNDTDWDLVKDSSNVSVPEKAQMVP